MKKEYEEPSIEWVTAAECDILTESYEPPEETEIL